MKVKRTGVEKEVSGDDGEGVDSRSRPYEAVQDEGWDDPVDSRGQTWFSGRIDPSTQGGGDVGQSEQEERHGGLVQPKRLRIGLAGARTNGRALSEADQAPGLETSHAETLKHDGTVPVDVAARRPSSRRSTLRGRVESLVETVGDVVLALFGFDEADWFDFDVERFERDVGDGEVGGLGIEGGNGALASWSESSVYVERTNSLHPSRPSAFGPHLVSSPLRGLLFPIEFASPSENAYGCPPPSVVGRDLADDGAKSDEGEIEGSRPSLRAADSIEPLAVGRGQGKDEGWIALVERGKCQFSAKVRFAQDHGAKAVVFGDQDEREGGIRGGHGLLTPWSPDDTSDIEIPSIFVSRASYLSLFKTWEEEQDLARGRDGGSWPWTGARGRARRGGRGGVDEGTQTDDRPANSVGDEPEWVGLEVVLSKDEMFAWPLLDLLFLLLFVPSLLTLLTVFTQRVRLARAQKAERAPKEAVAKLVVFKWGEVEKAKPALPRATGGGGEAEAGSSAGDSSGPSGDEGTREGSGANAGRNSVDEEREIGLGEASERRAEPTESTSLLVDASAPAARTPATASRPSLLQRLVTGLGRLTRRRSTVSLSSPTSPSASSSHLPLGGPSVRYPSLNECPICLDAFVAHESIVMELPCGHLFHRDCAMSWLLRQRGICPVCRRSVMEDDDADDEDNVADGGGTARVVAGAGGGGASSSSST
ncbi:hypothetical protein JCM10212_006873 [Sporobolomyces blumeae]